MTRTIAIILTLLAAACCGLPGLGLICMAALGGLGSQTADFQQLYPEYSPEQLGLGIGVYVCFGVILLVIPVLVGVLSFRASRRSETAVQSGNNPPPGF